MPEKEHCVYSFPDALSASRRLHFLLQLAPTHLHQCDGQWIKTNESHPCDGVIWLRSVPPMCPPLRCHLGGSLEVTLELQCFVTLTKLLQRDSVTPSVCPLNRVQLTRQNCTVTNHARKTSGESEGSRGSERQQPQCF